MDNLLLPITKMLTVSAYHVTHDTFEALSLDGVMNEIMLPVYEKSAPGNGENFGLIIELEPVCVEQGRIPEDLASIIKLCQENGCQMLCLDFEGRELEGFPVYEWEE